MTDRRSGALTPTIAALLAYLFGPFSGIFFLLFAKSMVAERDDFVRFHALQSTLLFVSFAVVHLALRSLGIVGRVVLVPLFVMVVILWVRLMLAALRGERRKVKFLGDVAEHYIFG